MEIWKDIPGYEGIYQVSDLGNVKSLDRVIKKGKHFHTLKGRILKTHTRKDGYKTITISKKGEVKTYLIHHLVAKSFLNHTPDGLKKVIDHKNDIKNDNRLENLQIITHRKNTTKRKYRGNTDSVGVHWCKYRKKFLSNIQENGKQVLIGIFETEKEASKHYKKAEIQIAKGEKVSLIRKPLSSKYRGVTWHKKEGKWRSQIRINGKQKQIGSYKTELEAHNAYVEFSKKLKNEKNGI